MQKELTLYSLKTIALTAEFQWNQIQYSPISIVVSFQTAIQMPLFEF